MKKYVLFSIFLILCLLVLNVGCSKKDCQEDSDCSSKIAPACKQYSCTNAGTCILRDKPNCCLNEQGQECKGKIGNFIENYCDEAGACKQRITGGQSDYADTIKLSFPNAQAPLAQIDALYSYNTPFDLTHDQIKVIVKPTLIKQTDIVDLKLEKLKLTRHYGRMISDGRYTDSRTEPLGERTVGQIFWDTSVSTEDDLLISTTLNDSGSEQMIVTLSLIFTYKKKVGTSWVTETFEKEVPISKEPLTLLWPKVPDQTCPICQRSTNACIRYQCDNSAQSKSNFQCIAVYGKNCCGNRLCEAQESKCTCPKDCGRPEVEVGTLQVGYCEGSRWLTKLKTDSQQITASTKLPGGGGGFEWVLYVAYTDPLIVKDAAVDLTLRLSSLDPTVIAGPTISIVQVKGSGNTLYGEVTPNVNVGQSDATITIPLTNLENLYKEYEEGTLTNVQVFITYKITRTVGATSREFTMDATYTIPKITVVNPTGDFS